LIVAISEPTMVRTLCLLYLLAFSLPALAQNATTPGAASAPFPTINNIALEWAISGDANANSSVAVRYRASGQNTWRAAQPLQRVPAGSNAGFSWANRHSGSVFGLNPGSSYEFELSLSDPDGGDTTRVLSATTRMVPVLPSTGTLRLATPANLASVLSTAQPGDIVELSAGNYAGFTIDRSGSATLPIVLRGTSGATINGEIGIFNRSDLWLHQLRVNGRIRFNGTNNMIITECTVNAQNSIGNGDGIVSYLRAQNSFIADNTVIGTTPWNEAALGVSGNNLGEGILVTGPGHVITRNLVRGFRDNISLLEDAQAIDQFSIDITDNTLDIAADDAIEADFCFHNCRVLRNRVSNAFIAFSSQPSLGGPTYFIRNSAYNVLHVPFKLYRSSVGDVILHNTIIKNGDALNAYPGVLIARTTIRNNLFLGGTTGSFNGFSSGSGRVIDMQSLDTGTAAMNYNGYGTTLGSFTGRIGATTFNSLAQLRALTSESAAQQVDYSIFEGSVVFPTPGNPLTLYALPNLRIRADSTAANAALVMANINDDFVGSAPDLGAFEAANSELILQNGFE
jgi:hypothetical protein